jgi:hypothetical protein
MNTPRVIACRRDVGALKARRSIRRNLQGTFE